MKTFLIFLSLLFLTISCKKTNFNDFDFTYGNTFETDFSIKFDNKNDSVFMRENWARDNSKPPKSETNYLSKLNRSQQIKFDSFMNIIDFKRFDTLYYQNYSDGDSYQFYIKKDGFEKKIKVHSHEVPKELQDFAVWIYQTKKSLSLKETKKSFDFKSKGIYVKPEKLDK